MNFILSKNKNKTVKSLTSADSMNLPKAWSLCYVHPLCRHYVDEGPTCLYCSNEVLLISHIYIFQNVSFHSHLNIYFPFTS